MSSFLERLRERETEKKLQRLDIFLKHECSFGGREFPCPCSLCEQIITSKNFADNLCHACNCSRQWRDEVSNCSFIIHKSCSETVPGSFKNHPFHPQHDQLTLSYCPGRISYRDICSACGEVLCKRNLPTSPNSDFHYQCLSPRCQFFLHIKCAVLAVTNKTNTNSELGDVDGRGQRGSDLVHLHPHPLISCNKGENFSYSCSCCKLPLVDDADGARAGGASTSSTLLVCLECNGLLHRSCADIVTRNIEQHPFHPSHPLIPLPRDAPCGPDIRESILCNVCRQEKRNDGFCYHCPECYFFIDFHCAHLQTKRNNGGDDDFQNNSNPGQKRKKKKKKRNKNLQTERNEDDEGDDFQNNNNAQQKKKKKKKKELGHSHPLIVWEDGKMAFPRTCYVCGACGSPFRDEDRIYFCPECKCLLDESCADLPQAIKHILHPDHELTICYHSVLDNYRRWQRCRACESTTGRFSYQCSICNFCLDIKCASMKHTVLTSRVHRHPLVLHEPVQDGIDYCHRCGEVFDTPFFRCLDRDFVTHVHCIETLPTKIMKSSRHPHPLTLTCSPMENHPGKKADFCCDAYQEKKLDPRYHCDECGYFAHPHCVVNEIIEILEEGRPSELSFGSDANEEFEATFEGFKDSLTSGEKLEVESVVQAYKDETDNCWLEYTCKVTGKRIRSVVSANQTLQLPWENWDPKSKVIKIDTTIWIIEEFAPMVTQLFAKHGNFCSKSSLSPKPRMFYITVVGEVLRNMSITNFMDVTTNLLCTWFHGLALGKQAGLEIEFAFSHLLRVAAAHFGLHASLFIDPNFSGVGDDEVKMRREILLASEESKEGTIKVDNDLISIGKSKLNDEIEELRNEINELEKTLEEKRLLCKWKEKGLSYTVDLMGKKAGKNFLELR